MRPSVKNLLRWAAWIFGWAWVWFVSLFYPMVLLLGVTYLTWLAALRFEPESLDRKAKRLVESLEQDLRRS